VARLEAHGRAGGDVEAHPLGRLAVELERGVDLEEMEMGGELCGPVPGIGDGDGGGLAALVGRNGVLPQDVFAGDHRMGLGTVTSLVPSGNVASICTSWIISGTPSMTSSRVSSRVPASMSSATVRPSRAPSSSAEGMRATASG